MRCLSCLTRPCSWIPQRYFMSIYCLIGLNIYYWIRVCVYLAMAEATFPLPPKNSTDGGYCPAGEKFNKTKKSKAEFHWDQDTQHFIIQGFYYGYIVGHIPGGVLSDKYGGKSVLGFGLLLSAVVSMAMPFLARLSYYCFFAGRIVQGLGQAVVFPGLSTMVAKWAPPNERSTITGITQSGVLFGNASAFISSGIILSFTTGWAEIFYINGALGVVWSIGWYLLCYSSPAQHPFISEKEKNMIETQIGQSSKRKPKKIPWKSILTSCPLYAAIIANYGHLWANFTMINEMPLYLNKVLHFDIKNSGVFSATPHISMIPTAIGAGYLCDWLVRKHIMSITVNRRVFVFLSNTLPVPFLILASLAGCEKAFVVILFAVMMFFKGLAYPTLKAQPVDLSPNFAGILMGILNGSGSIAGFVSPWVVGKFISGDGSLFEWRRFFILSGMIMIVSVLPFCIFGSGKVQEWNSVEEVVSENKEETENKDETSEPPK